LNMLVCIRTYALTGYVLCAGSSNNSNKGS
jgi:hypothetical protein